MQHAFVVCGLGFGDEGKGTTTHHLVYRHRAHTVIRTGGPQAFHRVVTSRGLEHIFSQFGSGTLTGAATHLSEHMVIDPDAILNEGAVLRYARGIHNPFDLMTVHQDALVITPFHGIANRLHELARGDHRHGTVGIGVGETVLDAETNPDEAIRARDLHRTDLVDLLERVRRRKIQELTASIATIRTLLSEEVQERAENDIAELNSFETTQWALERFLLMAKTVKIVDTQYAAEKIFGVDGVVVFEGSQGVLLDRFIGFHPYTTKVDATPAPALSLLKKYAYAGGRTVYGVIRGYHTRHGTGPFVTESPDLTQHLPDSYNGDHGWQGRFRSGSLDLIALRYALESCGGTNTFDGIVLTCIDRVHALGAWHVCTGYECGGPTTNQLLALPWTSRSPEERLARQEQLAEFLFNCKPVERKFKVPANTSPQDLAVTCGRILTETLPVPVRIVSLGPTEVDKFELS